MRIKFAAVFGAVALVAVGAAAALRKDSPEKPSPRPRRHAAVGTARTESEGETPVVAARSSERPAAKADVSASPAARAEILTAPDRDSRDAAAVALMGAPCGDLLPELRRRFLSETDPVERLRLAHVLIAQHKRFGFPLEVDREAMSFLTGIVRDPESGELHGSAIAALARWETPESLRAVGGAIVDPTVPADALKAAEYLAQSRSPQAAAAALDAFQKAEADDKVAVANVLLKMSSESPELGLAPVLRGQVRPALEKLLAEADDDWSRRSISRMLEALP